MSDVTWEQLTEAQRDYLGVVCEADGWILSPFYDFIIPLDVRRALFDWGLLEQGGGGRKNNILERATAAGLEVYAQRNTAPVFRNGERFRYTDGKFERVEDAPLPTEPLTAVWQSTAALYERFGLKPNVQNTTEVFSEETAELLHAAMLESPVNTALEAADVIVTALGICMARGVTLDEVVAAIRATVAKNDDKTHETHAVNEAGKIARKATP